MTSSETHNVENIHACLMSRNCIMTKKYAEGMTDD